MNIFAPLDDIPQKVPTIKEQIKKINQKHLRSEEERLQEKFNNLENSLLHAAEMKQKEFDFCVPQGYMKRKFFFWFEPIGFAKEICEWILNQNLTYKIVAGYDHHRIRIFL